MPMSESTDAGIIQVRDVDRATLVVLRERARSLGQSLSGYLRDLMDADAAAETNAEVIARIARDREPARKRTRGVSLPVPPCSPVTTRSSRPLALRPQRQWLSPMRSQAGPDKQLPGTGGDLPGHGLGD